MRSCYVLIYTIIQVAKELCRVVLLDLEKNRKRHNDVFHYPKGFQAASVLAAFSIATGLMITLVDKKPIIL